MSEKIRQQIMLDNQNYMWLIEEQIGRRHKNLSVTINEIIKNYIYLIKLSEKKAKDNNILQEKQKQLNEQVNSYRNQIINAKPIKITGLPHADER